MSTLTTVGGWATVLAVAGGIYYISGRKEKTRRPPLSKQAAKAHDSKKEVKGKKAKKAAGQSDGDSEAKSAVDKKQKKKTTVPQVNPEQPAYPSTRVTQEADNDDEADNREFARQMAKAKTGAIAAPKSKGETRQKSVKQNKAQEKLAIETSSDNATAPSSANGGDADDDQSPINSPDLSATTVESPVTNGGVSDMLEKPAPGPSVLKITEPTNPAPKKPKPQAIPEPAETKKQRQNRQKAEAKKLARQEDEAERQKLLEQQRRTARMAEGRAAKDGSTFMASKAPATSSWAASPPPVNGNAATTSKNVELLDTIEPTSTKPAAVPSSKPIYSESQDAGSNWQASLLSEEEQIRLIQEDDNWETVKGKEKKNRANKAAQKENQTPKEDQQSSADEKKEYGLPPKIAPSGPGKKWDATLVHVDENRQVVEREVELQDSEWEVS